MSVVGAHEGGGFGAGSVGQCPGRGFGQGAVPVGVEAVGELASRGEQFGEPRVEVGLGGGTRTGLAVQDRR